MNEETLKRLQARLDEFHRWPCRFMFKFIAPREKAPELIALFAETSFSTRSSRNGRYLSLTVELEMKTSGEVIAIYRRVGQIEGILAL